MAEDGEPRNTVCEQHDERSEAKRNEGRGTSRLEQMEEKRKNTKHETQNVRSLSINRDKDPLRSESQIRRRLRTRYASCPLPEAGTSGRGRGTTSKERRRRRRRRRETNKMATTTVTGNGHGKRYTGRGWGVGLNESRQSSSGAAARTHARTGKKYTINTATTNIGRTGERTNERAGGTDTRRTAGSRAGSGPGEGGRGRCCDGLRWAGGILILWNERVCGIGRAASVGPPTTLDAFVPRFTIPPSIMRRTARYHEARR
ncbi:hypothetical protein L226DRAFT_265236 [Lentinus tigrinus ALCF2SS1-7]|uniref:uncharacterized protein n=1 Tax=Lentinus tigrinus ALCF2SS1-7 TaxID=1328758 RepID=UPI001165F79B|nr:hypothetical protein L226DRAFT_265236 [Lentinus tigrinus ALCF2SS1-7]